MTEEEYQKRLKEQGMTTKACATKRAVVGRAKTPGQVHGRREHDHEVEEFYAANKQQFIEGRGLG